jgi:hypothetical protein
MRDAASAADFGALWDNIDVIYCLTLRTRPERRQAATAQFERVGLSGRVLFLEQEPDVADGKRGCFRAHQQAASLALERGAHTALTFEVRRPRGRLHCPRCSAALRAQDDVEFLPHFTPYAAARAAAFLRAVDAPAWRIFFLGHFPRKMELTEQPDVVRVRSMDGHAYVLSAAGMAELRALEYAGDQVDVHYHYQSEHAYALYPMVAVQTPGPSDTEGLARPEDWNAGKLERERALYDGCVRRKAVAMALGPGGGGTLGAILGHEA